jgi:hypothetical protein
MEPINKSLVLFTKNGSNYDLKRTMCCVQYCILAGLERKEAEGTRAVRGEVRQAGRGGRGKIRGDPGSAGPGTNRN